MEVKGKKPLPNGQLAGKGAGRPDTILLEWRISGLSLAFARDRAESYLRQFHVRLAIKEQEVALDRIWTDQPNLWQEKLEFALANAMGEEVLQITLLNSYFTRAERAFGPVLRVEEGNHRLRILHDAGRQHVVANVVTPADHRDWIVFPHELTRPWDLPLEPSPPGVEVHSDAVLMARRLSLAI